MRCQFCGWDNPQGKERCEKCGKPLSDSDCGDVKFAPGSNQGNSDRPTDRQVAGVFNPKVTVRESQTAENRSGNEHEKCPECGYPLENGECPACGYVASNAADDVTDKASDDPRKTIRPMRKAEKNVSFKLVPISEETGLPEGDELSYEGNEVILNRANTNPKNETITSQEQASITLIDGKWNVEDKSEYKTTFIQASRKIEIHKGDLILLGNQLYRFDQ